ncbi:ImmA/IrrE family metallo-endopeptidase [Corynebacterium lizhenjunii]|uniref:ImmA/IrrE family metallo-endopeptidase n=1 Tax=Corynebacterium lizhenjunii TaxID=2709394 RepID=UPI0013ED3AED|nr:ImmA/IrrE family metallo-endopeptidase [Corynebacterium lizhenjunii]
MTVRIPVNPEIVRWAAARAGGSENLLKRHPHLEKWIAGESQPTFKQLQEFSNRVDTPMGYFLLSEVPRRQLPIADFRDGFDPGVREDSPELWATLNTCQRRQDWYQEYAESIGIEPVWVVGIAADWNAQETASHMRKTLKYEVNDRKGDASSQRRYLISQFELLGGLTAFNSMVNDNVYRPLNPDEFRGFSLVSPVAPLIFVNAKQTINGQLFTFAHELAHVWRGKGALGNAKLNATSSNEVEQWCNLVASEFLVPAVDLKARYPVHQSESVPEILESLAKVYKCGTLVVLNGLKRSGILSEKEFQELYPIELKRLSALASSAKGDNSGGNIQYSRAFRLGRTFSQAVIRELASGRLLPTDALQLTGIKTFKSFDAYADYIEGQV